VAGNIITVLFSWGETEFGLFYQPQMMVVVVMMIVD
jgi:hypothetical protein